MLSKKMTNSKSLLLRAWRERWTDVQWSINIKRLIQTEDTEEVQQLADLMVNQSLLGSTPNMLILSYLKHTISSKTISLVAAIQSVVKYKEISKPYCIKSLFEVMEIFIIKISLHGSHEDALSLAQASLLFLHWLLDCMVKFIQKLWDGKLQPEYSTLLERGCDILDKTLKMEENRALLFIAKSSNGSLFNMVEKSENMIWTLLGQSSGMQIESNLRGRLHDSINGLTGIQNFPMKPQPNLDVSFHSLNLSINVVTGIEAVLNPTNDIPLLIEHLLVIERAQGLSRPSLYCELLRTCMMGMADAAGGTDELKWASFTFLKLPRIFKHLVKQKSEKSAADQLEEGINKLLDFVPLLDATDAKCHCECLSYLMHEICNKHSSISEEVFRKIMNRRQAESQRQRPTEQPSQQPSACLILRAEPTLYSILKTLDTDYSKNQEPLRGVLSQMMSGKSLELILAAAAASGKVQSFAMKIVKFNELSKHAAGEGANAAQIRATIFDISFLMLCHISQLYGLHMITSCPEGANSFFAQWATKSLPEDGKYKSLDLMLTTDHPKVEVLLGQINPGGELKLGLTKWHEVCRNAPYVMQEVLYAWEHGTLAQESVQQIVENLKFRMCCMPVIVVSWLCSFITVSDSEARRKPLQILQWFVSQSSSDPSTKNRPGQPSELSNLMLAIIRKMAHDLLPQVPGTPQRSLSYTLPPTMPIVKALVEKFNDIFQRGCINIEAIHQMSYLLNVGGTLWFCENVVKEVLSHDRVEDINKGVSLAFSLFHLDLNSLTLDLVHHVVPQMLQLPNCYLKKLMDPRGRALARMAVMCLCACHSVKTLAQKEGSPVKRGKKRSRTELELEEPQDKPEDARAQKLRRLSSACEELLPPSFGSDTFGQSSLVNAKEEEEVMYDASDPLSKALVNLFRLFHTILSQSQVSPCTGFVSSFVEEILKCGSSTTRYILQFMPTAMVPQLVRCLDNSFSVEILLHICDLNTIPGRKVAAKIICQQAHNKAKEAATTEETTT